MTAEPEIRRQARSIRNDERILDVATEIVATDGWAGLLPARVAERSGLSHPAISARFADRSAIGAGVWRDRLAAPMIARLEAALDAAGLLDWSAADPRRLAEAMQPFVEPDMIMCAAAEILVENCFDANVKAAVHATLGEALARWLTPVPRKLTKANAARRSFLIITALGVLLETRRQEGMTFDFQAEWDRICAALSAPDSAERLPEIYFEHWDGIFDFDSGDALLDRLLEATRDEIGRHGYEATTIDTIARAAGRTKGLVFSRYPSKKQLFNDTVTRFTKAMYELNEQAWQEMLTVTSSGGAEAILYKELMRPGREHLRGFALEQYRLSWHDVEMRDSIAHAFSEVMTARAEADPTRPADEVRAEFFIGVAQGIGILLVADVDPHAWELPYQNMTVPLNQ